MLLSLACTVPPVTSPRVAGTGVSCVQLGGEAQAFWVLHIPSPGTTTYTVVGSEGAIAIFTGPPAAMLVLFQGVPVSLVQVSPPSMERKTPFNPCGSQKVLRM